MECCCISNCLCANPDIAAPIHKNTLLIVWCDCHSTCCSIPQMQRLVIISSNSSRGCANKGYRASTQYISCCCNHLKIWVTILIQSDGKVFCLIDREDSCIIL